MSAAKNKTITVICPLYNAEKYLRSLHSSLLSQKDVMISDINYIVTKSSDATEKIVKELPKCKYSVILPEEFSHSTVRESAAMSARTGIVVFITQDVVVRDNEWLAKLVAPIINGECDASFSRQICENNSIEKYTREFNYPAESRLISKDDIGDLGLRAFFFSDAASAIRREVFVELNGYDQKRLPINEDMYFAHKLIMSGRKIKYCADSVVYHSHDFSAREQYKRYYDTGKFFAENSYLNDYKVTDAGASLAKYVLKRAAKDKNFYVLFKFLPNMGARYLGMRRGRNA